MACRRRPVLVAAGIAALLAFVSSATPAWSAPDSSGVDVLLEVERVSPPPGRQGGLAQYLCTARIQRLSGEVLSMPRITTSQGVQASVTSYPDAGGTVALRVLVSAPNRLSFEVEITSPGGVPEHHKATVALPQ